MISETVKGGSSSSSTAGLERVESAVVGGNPRGSDGQMRKELLTVVLEPLVDACPLQTEEDPPMEINDRLARHPTGRESRGRTTRQVRARSSGPDQP